MKPNENPRSKDSLMKKTCILFLGTILTPGPHIAAGPLECGRIVLATFYETIKNGNPEEHRIL
ncbi:MAG: hypothetical protein NTY64_19565, partial [Deltaproteobacteria bacterium]|nr:hypothetical protein [Deltaproteobacteria bacterium]